ncbi:MAG: ATP-binding protein [Ginsengibacter sp.]
MSEGTINNWNEANQRYLMAAVRIVREELELDKSVVEGEDKSSNSVAVDIKSTVVQDNSENVLTELSSPASLDFLANIFGLSSFEKTILIMCAGVELDSRFAELITRLQGGSSLPSFSLALSSIKDAHWSALSPNAPLRYWRLIEIVNNPLLSKAPLKIDEHILHYLTGVHHMDERLAGIVRPFFANQIELVPSHLELANRILEAQSIENSHGLLPVIELTGENKPDKESIAAHLSLKFGMYPFSISINAIPSSVKDNIELTRIWNREAALKAGILFLDYTDLDVSDKSRLQSVNNFIENIQSPIIISSGQNTCKLVRQKRIYVVIKPTAHEQFNLWKGQFGNDVDLSDEEIKKLVAQFNLSTKTIHAAVAGLENGSLNNLNASLNGSILKKIWKSCCLQARPDVGELAQRIEPIATMNDLVLPETQKDILKELVMQVKQRIKVYNEWGFASRSQRGLGITALFTGESGTGKTMAAEVLANELQLDLYRIDLSQVINKYIGETEKNLKKIFDSAEEGGAILLFDEADALFGKRSEVKDSHDRYANIEVSYLLQRMEAYRGLAILTTNMKNTLDKAWMRRIRFIIQFPFPDIAQREEIWRKIFPIATPTQNLEIGKLARLNIAGGNIRNIALNAAFIAANEGTPVGMSQVSRAVRSEYNKLEKPLANIESTTWK